MSLVVLAFPGQGCQRRGMAADFVERFAVARRVFDEASAALDLDLAAICFGKDPRLDLTEFTQPCILTAEIAMFTSLTQHFGLYAEKFGGHSLGEYTALVAAGALPLASAARLVRRRGALMQAAVPVGQGGRSAIRSPRPRYSAGHAAIAAAHDIDVANFNAPSQGVGHFSRPQRSPGRRPRRARRAGARGPPRRERRVPLADDARHRARRAGRPRRRAPAVIDASRAARVAWRPT